MTKKGGFVTFLQPFGKGEIDIELFNCNKADIFIELYASMTYSLNPHSVLLSQAYCYLMQNFP